MSRALSAEQAQRSLTALTGTVLGVAVVSALYWAQVVFIPLGLALFLTFVLTPVVRALQRKGFGRVLAVVTVVSAAALIVAGSTFIVGRQLTHLMAELPDYSENIRGKIKSLRSLGTGNERLEQMFDEVGREFKADRPKTSGDAITDEPTAVQLPRERPTTVILQPASPGWLANVPVYLSSALDSLGTLAFAWVLLIFILLNREDLRNRFLRLVGHGRVSFTTKAVDDAGQRISRYLLMQAIVNGTFGLALTIGLLVIGVEYAALWGLMAALLRYVPYIGAWIAAAFPILLSLAMFESWWPPVAVIALVLTLELLSNNVMEPWLYGQSMGVSTVAQLVSAAFWAFLWGPVGLILAAPLTVVLLVLGKHVPQLKFLEVLLGDEPVLEPNVTYYQRLLARDQDEAVQLVLAASEGPTPELVYDEFLVSSLNFARRDRDRDELTDADQEYVLRATSEFLDDLGERRATEAAAEAAATTEPVIDSAYEPLRILACPARDESDRLALEMLKRLLDPAKWDVEITSVETLTSELVERVASENYSVVCIGSLPPGGLAHTRYLCKRLRSRLPGVRIMVGRWGLRANIETHRQRLQDAGADEVATTLLETREQLETSLPFLRVAQPAAAAG